MTALAPARSFVAPNLFEPAPERWALAPLEPQTYDLIMADPPWHMELRSEKGEAKSPQAHYDTMPIDEIAALPVADLARETCLLWLWATGLMIDQQIAVMKAWGFGFITSGVWVKTTQTGKLNFGTGFFLRGSHEIFILGKRGDVPQPRKGTRNQRSVIMAPVREHSRKPDEAYDAAERLTSGFPARKGGLRRLDLFSRTNRPGWDAWGKEAGKFGTAQRSTIT